MKSWCAIFLVKQLIFFLYCTLIHMVYQGGKWVLLVLLSQDPESGHQSYSISPHLPPQKTFIVQMGIWEDTSHIAGSHLLRNTHSLSSEPNSARVYFRNFIKDLGWALGGFESIPRVSQNGHLQPLSYRGSLISDLFICYTSQFRHHKGMCIVATFCY